MFTDIPLFYIRTLYVKENKYREMRYKNFVLNITWEIDEKYSGEELQAECIAYFVCILTNTLNRI